MNFETLEQMRYENTKKVMESMAADAANSKLSPKQRREAAKIVDVMSDSLIKAYLLTQVTNEVGKGNKKLHNQLDQLIEGKD